MLAKPASCRGCPLYQNGQGFVPDEIKPGAKVLIYGQNPGEQEEQEGRPFVGRTGAQMDKFLPLAGGLSRSEVSVGNAIRCRWQKTNDLPPIESVMAREAMLHCTRTHFKRPEGVKLILTQGGYALWAMTGYGNQPHHRVSDWRGYVLPWAEDPVVHLVQTSIWMPNPHQITVLPTLHLASLFRDPEGIVPTQKDWAKVPFILSKKWPTKMPAYANEILGVSGVVSFDTEYHPDSNELYRYSISDGAHPWVVDAPFKSFVIYRDATIVMHNAEADLGHLAAVSYGEPPTIEDTMYMHSVLWPGLPHDLNYLGSLYASINRWKHLMLTAPMEYSAADAWGTMDAYKAMQREFERDPASRVVYVTLMRPLIPIIRSARRAGIRVDQERARVALDQLVARTRLATLTAQAAAGWPINLASPAQVTKQLYQIERLSQRGK